MIKTQKMVHEIDAAGESVGRVATRAAFVLMGKHSPAYEPRIDARHAVQIVNAGKVRFTGRKLVQKDYYHHTMYPGGIKRTPMQKVFDKNPADVMRRAVYGMLPKNNRREELMKRLTIRV